MEKANRPLKVMIVEDEPDLLSLYREALPKDWNIDFFDSARKAAMHYGLQADYDLVVTDIHMAHKTGEGLIFDIKYINPNQKIIVLSGRTADLNIPEAFQVKIFQKPWDVRNVVDVFNNWDQSTRKTKN